ncbi:hypothetical protein GCK32_003072 [Trichostrongylus colubriformis]|uniref:Uncharacterized protein n=1 Tax=Trichostrongylus colubriformis TaxID=6319 RepID=A0AAN8EXS0_TRICO
MFIIVDRALPQMIFIATYAVLCFIIAISLIIYRRMMPNFSQGFSLQKRFQDKENGCTVPIYTCISANELLVTVALSSLYAMKSNSKNLSAETDSTMNDLIDVIDAYRILFINIAILFNWIIWKRNQKRIFIEHHADGAEYFRQLQISWK